MIIDTRNVLNLINILAIDNCYTGLRCYFLAKYCWKIKEREERR